MASLHRTQPSIKAPAPFGSRTWTFFLGWGTLLFLLSGLSLLKADSLSLLLEQVPDTEPYGFGWYESETLGFFYPLTGTDWVYHEDLGFIFVVEAENGGFFGYQYGLGWWWTDSEAFPYIYRFGRNEWGFLDRESADANQFFVYSFEFNAWNGYPKLQPSDGFSYYFPDSPQPREILEVQEIAVDITTPNNLQPFQTGSVNVSVSGDGDVGGKIFWGDGKFTTFSGNENLEHSYTRAGVYTVRVYYDGVAHAVQEYSISVGPEAPHTRLETLDLVFSNYQGNLKGKTTSFIGPGAERPDPVIEVDVTFNGQGGEALTLELWVEDPEGNSSMLESQEIFLPFLEEGVESGSVTFSFSPDYPLTIAGLYQIWVQPEFLPLSVQSGLITPLAYYNLPNPDPEDSSTQALVYLMQVEVGLARAEWKRAFYVDLLEDLQLESQAQMALIGEWEEEESFLQIESGEGEVSLENAINAFQAQFPNWEIVIGENGQFLRDAQEIAENIRFPGLAATHGPDLPIYRSRTAAGSVGAFPLSGSYPEDLGISTGSSSSLLFDRKVSRPFWEALDAVGAAKVASEGKGDGLAEILNLISDAQPRLALLENQISEVENELNSLNAEISSREDLIEALVDYKSDFELELLAHLNQERNRDRKLRRISRKLEWVQEFRDLAVQEREVISDQLANVDEDDFAYVEASAQLNESLQGLNAASNDFVEASTLLTEVQSESEIGAASALLDSAETKILAGSANVETAWLLSSSAKANIGGARPSPPAEEGDTRTTSWREDQFFTLQVLDLGVGAPSEEPEWLTLNGGNQLLLGRFYGLIKLIETLHHEEGEIQEAIFESFSDSAIDSLGLESAPFNLEVEDLVDSIYGAFSQKFEGSSELLIHLRLGGYLYRARTSEIFENGVWRTQSETREITEDPAFIQLSLPSIPNGNPAQRMDSIKVSLEAMAGGLGIQEL